MWPEVERAKAENRHELVLGGHEIAKRVDEAGLDGSIFQLTSLNYLDIHDTSLKTIPDDVSKLAHLQSLVLHSNKLEVANANIAKLDKLRLLDMSRNQLKQVPEEVDGLVNVVTLNFNYNLLEAFPKLVTTRKLTVLDLSHNKLKLFPDVCHAELANLAELKLSENEIQVIPPEINHLPTMKVLELGRNKIKTVPGELADCTKLKVLDLKNNPISDRRLLKLIDQCRTKQIVDYVKAHCPKTSTQPPPNLGKKSKQKSESSDSEESDFKHVIRVHYAKDNLKIVVNDSVKTVREFLAACLVDNVSFTEETFRKFIQIQNKLHETVCSKRNSSTIATHDFNKLVGRILTSDFVLTVNFQPPGDLTYTTLPPNELVIKPLNRAAAMTGSELFARLQAEANNLRKEKKRSTYSGIHKYLYLIEGHPKYPCLLNSEGAVVSFPPITNSEVTKIDLQTKRMLIEVTSSVSLHLCKTAIESLLKEMVSLLEQDLELTQVRTTDREGNLKVVYPSKTDLNFQGGDIKVVRD
ncbi:leucine-rich repeat-containing protein 47 [Asbolus verrucosus]|uniref:Leucine-rich repeat-containing protein 47 n=1 Tax=Asbolus verrucosus TaxID=1661398 RepID=A0A482VHQ8_ASBVE|nr:leucine-rich repeat-containing protein 47 [Asbolus verrucosus]